MMDQLTTTYRTASAERCFPLSSRFDETPSALAGFLAAARPFTAVQEAFTAAAVKSWTLIGSTAPPAPVPLRLA